MDGRIEVCHFGSSIGTQKFNFYTKILPGPKICFTRFYACHFRKGNWTEPSVLYLMNDFYAIFLIFR